ncbi:hypothetical protein NDU88_001862 [Pleurodeles waltl]|uniref:Reverse transcriptase domain-containing protein n=1 Tax=Pleurodeles waltl TaxID=8319 RepID=A0AAV7RBJ9_PLEWA|nr:hypothetical protein NDU88_001862 [Pleurodeles waltl]
MGGECTYPFQVQKGVLQGCCLAPLLFSLFLDEMVHYFLEKQLDDPVVAGGSVPILLFADNAVLMARTENEAHRLLDCFAKYCKEKSLIIDCSKSIGMTLQPSPSLQRKFVINAVPIDAIKHFDYLGVWFSDNLNWGSHVRKAVIVLKQAAEAILEFKHKAGARSISTILKIYAPKAVAAALYGTELWGYANTSVLQVADNNC